MRFFRNKRLELAGNNRFLKYLRYAIGEVLLIVVGILLALYLSNLKEASNIRHDQVRILRELRSNLDNTIIAFRRSINTEQNYLGFNQLKTALEQAEVSMPFPTQTVRIENIKPNG